MLFGSKFHNISLKLITIYKYGYKIKDLYIDNNNSKIELEDIINMYHKFFQEKKDRISKKHHWPEILAPNVTKKSWYKGGPFSICFVYSNKGNFVVKGWMGDIESYLKGLINKGYKFFYKLSMYHYGIERSGWFFYKENIHIRKPSLKVKNKKNKFNQPYHFTVYSLDNDLYYKFKRLPNRWIPEFDKISLK